MTEKGKYIKIHMPKEVDHLVYKSHDADSELLDVGNLDAEAEHCSDSSFESDNTARQAERLNKLRSKSQHALKERLFPSKIDRQRNQRFVEVL